MTTLFAQARRFKRLGLSATPVNAEVWNETLHQVIPMLSIRHFSLVLIQALIKKRFRIILTSPEMCLSHPPFSKLMRSRNFTEDVAAIISDEAHCISQWGECFRKAFGELGRLRSYVPTTVPFLATSATLPPLVLADVQDKLGFSADNTLMVNLGNDRLNITPILCPMHGAARDLAALDFLVDEALRGDPLKRTIVFFNNKDLTAGGCEHLRELLPDNIQDQVDFLHAWRDPTAKRKVMKDFRSGKIKILCATEAAGMVCTFTI